MSKLLPLFPLDLVLLPGTRLPLHVFEPRYKEMITECLAQKKFFGVVRAKEEQGVAEIGCTAEILNVTKKYPDGRMDIMTSGRERFEVMLVNNERPFLQAEVLYLQDEPSDPTQAEKQRALELHRELLNLAGAVPQEATEDATMADAVTETTETEDRLSFRLVGQLPLDLDFKQTLLGMKSEVERLQGIISYFETILPSLKRSIYVRQKAGGNGHAG